MTGTILTGAILSGVNLSGVDLSGKDLTGANLKGVFLGDADITKATIGKETLNQAILCNTRTIDGTVSDCDLRKVDFTLTNLSGVNLSGKDLTGANLSGVYLSGKDLTSTTLIQANLSRANLSGVDLTGANLSGTDLTGANLTLAEIVRPFAPTNLETTSVGDDFISMTWTDNAHDELGYLVYISSGKKPDLPVTTLAADVTSYTFENLNAENYIIWIEAVGRPLNSDALIKFQGTKGAPPNHLKVDKSKGEWSLLVIPDTQYYVNKKTQNKAPLSNMVDAFDWIVLIADDLNIKMVQGLGDITENQINDLEWEYASEIWFKLEGKVPFVPNIGNHDDETKFKYYFPESRFVNEPWWGGNYDGITNSYQLMTIGNEDYLFVNTEVFPGTANINWINRILDFYQDRKVILASHIIEVSSLVNKQIISQHDNIVLTNAGHYCREKHFIENGPGGGVSNNFTVDYTCDETEIMLLRFYVFKPLEDKVYFYTYSPITNEFEVDDSSQGSFDLVQADP